LFSKLQAYLIQKNHYIKRKTLINKEHSEIIGEKIIKKKNNNKNNVTRVIRYHQIKYINEKSEEEIIVNNNNINLEGERTEKHTNKQESTIEQANSSINSNKNMTLQKKKI
jgi:hypothetical protein